MQAFGCQFTTNGRSHGSLPAMSIAAGCSFLACSKVSRFSGPTAQNPPTFQLSSIHISLLSLKPHETGRFACVDIRRREPWKPRSHARHGKRGLVRRCSGWQGGFRCRDLIKCPSGFSNGRRSLTCSTSTPRFHISELLSAREQHATRYNLRN